MTYECTICLQINHAVKMHCSTCGAVPAIYSFTGKPLKGVYENDSSIQIEVFVAQGAIRQGKERTSKVYFRTVPADYYSEI